MIHFTCKNNLRVCLLQTMTDTNAFSFGAPLDPLVPNQLHNLQLHGPVAGVGHEGGSVRRYEHCPHHRVPRVRPPGQFASLHFVPNSRELERG